MLHTVQIALQNSWLAVLLTAVIAYLLGSINSAVLVSRALYREDVRNRGSGNAGATNVLRNYGKLPAALTVAGDLAKSFLAVLCGGFLLIHLQLTGTAEISEEGRRIVGRYLAGACCVLGHMFPLYFGFRGGKGVLTSFGMILILDIRVAAICLAVFLITVAISRMVSLGSVLGELAAPVLVYVFGAFADHLSSETVDFCVIAVSVIVAMVVIRHHENIVRIFKGVENKLHFHRS